MDSCGYILIMSIATEGLANPQFGFGDRIRKVRRDIAHMSQAEMAETLGVTQKAYAAWESGGKPGDIVTISKRIEELWPGRVTAGWMLGVGDHEPPPPPPPAVRSFPRRRQGPVRRLRPVEENGEIQVDDDAMAYLRLAGNPDDPDQKPVGVLPAPYQPAKAA